MFQTDYLPVCCFRFEGCYLKNLQHFGYNWNTRYYLYLREACCNKFPLSQSFVKKHVNRLNIITRIYTRIVVPRETTNKQ